jgi:uncharacterized LabA/DUF88 family protein
MPGRARQTKPKAIAYIDGFNFYHGAVKDAPVLKWLNLEALCDLLLSDYDVTAVNYYTARVKDRPEDPAQSQRQDDYLRALGSLPRVNLVFGQFRTKKSTVRLPTGKSARGKVWEEKGSDVNLGVDLSWDAAEKRMHTALVVSNDLDLQRAVTRAVGAGINVVVVNPHHRTNRRPSLVGSDTRTLHRARLRRCQLPDVVDLGEGLEVRRPSAWA